MATARLQDGPRTGPVRVLVAAAASVVRAGLEAVVASSPALALVGACATAAEAMAALRVREVDVLLLSADFAEADEWLEDAELGVVLLSDQAPWNGRGAGCAFLPSSATVDEIVAAVLAVAAGLLVWHPNLAPSAERSGSWAARDGISPQPLSAREIEVLRMLAEGLSNKAIAERLKISEHTVKFHVGSIFNKLNVATRTEAVTVGARLGLVLL